MRATAHHDQTDADGTETWVLDACELDRRDRFRLFAVHDLQSRVLKALAVRSVDVPIALAMVELSDAVEQRPERPWVDHSREFQNEGFQTWLRDQGIDCFHGGSRPDLLKDRVKRLMTDGVLDGCQDDAQIGQALTSWIAVERNRAVPA